MSGQMLKYTIIARAKSHANVANVFYERLVHSPGKMLTEPFLVLLVIALLAVAIALRGRQPARGPLRTALVALVGLWLLSTHIFAHFLERSVEMSIEEREPPEIIVVLAGGFVGGARPDFHLLSGASLERVATATEWWKRRPASRLILSGADAMGGRPVPRVVELMRDEAIRRGVPPALITLEPQAVNTRDHPRFVAQLPGLTSEAPVGVVTSRIHMRRALYSFHRYFSNVVPQPTPPHFGPRTILNRIVPSHVALGRSTHAIHEWIGLAWYALRDGVSPRRNDSPVRRAASVQR